MRPPNLPTLKRYEKRKSALNLSIPIQFSSLHPFLSLPFQLSHIPGLPLLCSRFTDLLAQVRARAPTNETALDVSASSTFDRDLLEAAVGVHALESEVLAATDAALESAPTVEHGAVRLRVVDGAARTGNLKVSKREEKWRWRERARTIPP